MAFNKYWIIVAVITIANILIFVFFSNKLESFVTDTKIEDDQKILEALK